jgi:outer membrane receptor protein involved in Fe transport
VNLLPQTVRGLDFGAYWNSPRTRFGRFEASANASRLLKYSRPPGPTVDQLVEARDSGEINAGTPLPETLNLIEANGRPKWRATGSLTWTKGMFKVGAFARYTGAVDETGFVDADGNPWRVKSQLTENLYAQVTFDNLAATKADVRWRVGVRNLTDKKPPLTSEGYLGSLYLPYARYWYSSLSLEL